MQRYDLYVFSLIFSLVFPFFGFAFTNFVFGQQVRPYDISLDLESLAQAGITLASGESHNITFKAAATTYTLVNTTTRIRWNLRNIEGFIISDAMVFMKQNVIERITNTWFNPFLMAVLDKETGFQKNWIDNSSMINGFNTDYNWSKFNLINEGIMIFVTVPHNSPGEPGNITQAVLIDGTVTVTLGEPMTSNFEFGFVKFAQWYISMLLGDQSFGLPGIFTWVIRIITGIGILSAVLLVREVIGFS